MPSRLSDRLPKILILDEPTANLPDAEAERLYALAKTVASTGVAVMFVSHHFDEVFELADTVTVIRDGAHIVTREVKGMTEDGLIEQVIGRVLAPFERDDVAAERGAVVLEAKGLTGSALRDVDITIHAGEVVGVAGITGSGRDELAPLIFGGVPRRASSRSTAPRSRSHAPTARSRWASGSSRPSGGRTPRSCRTPSARTSPSRGPAITCAGAS